MLKYYTTKFSESNESIPEYVNVSDAVDGLCKTAEGFLSKSAVWCSALDSLVNNTPETWEYIEKAASRYGIKPDVDALVDRVLNEKSAENRISGDTWGSRLEWLKNNTNHLSSAGRAKVAEYLLREGDRLSITCGMDDADFLSECIAGVPYSQDEATYKLATGTTYSEHQFNSLRVDELNKHVPRLLQEAYCGLPIIIPDQLGKTAELLSDNESYMLDCLFHNAGESPISVASPEPFEVSW